MQKVKTGRRQGVRGTHRRAILGDEVDHGLPQRSVGADELDEVAPAILVCAVSRLGELDVTRPRRGATDQTRHIQARAHVVADVKRPNVGNRPQRSEADLTTVAAAHAVETTADHHVPARFQCEGKTRTPRTRAQRLRDASKVVVGRVHEAGVQHPVRQQPRHAHPPRAVEGCEHAADQNRPVGLLSDGVDRAIGARAGIKSRVHRAVRIQTCNSPAHVDVHKGEGTTNENLLRGREGDGEYRVVRPAAQPVEGKVHRAIRIQPRQAVADLTAHRGERAGNQNLVRMQGASRGINRHGIHPVVRPAAKGVERRVRRTGGGQTHHPIVRRGVEGGEVAGHHHAAIGLQGDGLHRLVHHVTWVHARTGIKGAVKRAIRIDPGHGVAADAGVGTEAAADENPPIRLKRDGVDEIVRARTGVERGVNLTIVEQPRDTVAGGSIDRGEIAREDRALVRLNHQSEDHIIRTRGRVVRRVGETEALLVVRVVRRTRRLLTSIKIIGHNGHDGLAGGSHAIASGCACRQWAGGFLARGTYLQERDKDVLIEFHLTVVDNRNADDLRAIASANGRLKRLEVRREIRWTQ